ncbi:hypothetical protein EV426DRAFT_354653 [Tirmania nivea]|nr:hypothetical protein EV426DRAFT_354653 [Tirmania nivea]
MFAGLGLRIWLLWSDLCMPPSHITSTRDFRFSFFSFFNLGICGSSFDYLSTAGPSELKYHFSLYRNGSHGQPVCS